jgi:hypothetical protein
MNRRDAAVLRRMGFEIDTPEPDDAPRKTKSTSTSSTTAKDKHLLEKLGIDGDDDDGSPTGLSGGVDGNHEPDSSSAWGRLGAARQWIWHNTAGGHNRSRFT